MICIAGKNNIAVDILDSLIKRSPIDGLCVCLNADDKGENSWQKSLKKSALKQNVKIVKLEDIYHVKNLIFLSLEFDKIINPELFQTKKLYNIHFSLLPKYRGMYTSAWPILNNDKVSGVTLHEIDKGIDTGDIIDQISFKIDINDTARDLYMKYIKYGTALIKMNINKLTEGEKIETKQQDKYAATYYSKNSIDYDDLKIEFNKTAIDVYNQVRAYSFKEYQMPRIFDRVIEKCMITEKRSVIKPGSIVDENNNMIIVSSIDYDLILMKHCE